MLRALRYQILAWYVRLRYRDREIIMPGSVGHPNRPELMLLRALGRAEKRADGFLPGAFRITPANVLEHCDYQENGEPDGMLASMYEPYSPAHKLNAAEMWSALAGYVKDLPRIPLETRESSVKKSFMKCPVKWTTMIQLVSPTQIECEFSLPTERNC
jgi:hypothetical protein